MPTPRFLSGIQPSGELHLGNYFGAIREHVRLQDQGESYYFIANYHALTTVRDAATLRKNTFETAVTYLACGLDPIGPKNPSSKAVLFRQSDVPEVCELTWLLMTVTPMAMLENATSYKDKIERGLSPDAGLFTYPVLMAADILAQQSTIVPVGRDQRQHVEMTRDMAQKFNHQFGAPVFTIPELRLGEAPYVPGVDGAKMSKSYRNTIGIFDEGNTLKKTVMGIKTDAKTLEEPKDPENCTIFALYSLMATAAEQEELAAKYRAGGMGYGHAKQFLLEKIDATFGPMREKRKDWASRPKDVEEILQAGAVKARANARAVLDAARAACGIV
ncbi:MAG: tryptophan--tRNA ligase [Phycisphaeraceae bacterium]|nr:tryptophan--tRNA ligase [Phycisphaeraceae bacterium]MCW5754845.1 tryptophan--tRNA ligase [Phycisphaeraceae bacterium]